MNVSQLQEALQNNLREVRKYLKRFMVSTEDKHIHLLRVRIKMLRAMLRLPQCSDIMGEDLKEVKRLFQHVGKIRDPQIMLNLIASHDSSVLFKHLINHLKKKKAKALEHFKAKESHFLKMMNQIAGHDYPLNESITHCQYLAYFKQAALSLKATLQSVNPSVDLHDVRKQSKELIYNIKFLDSDELQWLEHYLKTEKLDVLQYDLGIWHDKVNLLELLKARKQTSRTKKALVRLESEIARSLEAVFLHAKDL